MKNDMDPNLVIWKKNKYVSENSQKINLNFHLLYYKILIELLKFNGINL